ncbi:MAG: rod shape-determining protein MreD [Bryobacteraceae bacterium]|jgi:rod shape-determining protein MreD
MTEYGDRYLAGHQREQVSRFRARVMLFVPLAAILFQVYVPRFWDVLGFLELPLLVTIYFALMRRSQLGGMFIGAAIGLAQDSLSIKQPLGMYGIVKTLVGYFAASVGMRIDVEHSVIRFLLTYFFYFFHQFLYWVLARGLLGRQITFDIQITLLLGLLNAIVGVTLFHFLDRLREPA